MSLNQNIAAVIMAAGKGTRMKADLVKVLHPVADKPMVFHSINNLSKVISSKNIYVVISYQGDLVKKQIEEQFNLNFVYQQTPLGTADAVKCALEEIKGSPDAILVVGADDSVFYSKQTLTKFISSHLKHKPSITMMTLIKKEDNTVAKIFRDKDGNFLEIVENFRYINSGKKSNEIGCGAYVFDFAWTKENIGKVSLSENGEYLLTDLLEIARQNRDKISLYKLDNPAEWVGINTPEELKIANLLMKQK
ncbi:NTP transferase domain-containing protein [Candidatus Daviesbacteria bacterium]|nr:NTP transferase domain-containing protein [Candidatus Daviesbacteria bacterium]